MFNFNNYKIGVLGWAGSGKTVLLTSLLWNLEEKQLLLAGECPRRVSIQPDKLHGFDYEGNQRFLRERGTFPKKTLEDFSKVKCTFKRSSEHFGYDVTFVDIPGERFDDIELWRAANYEEWSREQMASWRRSPLMSQCMADYLQQVEDAGVSQKLAWHYKLGMRRMLGEYVNQVSPSTLFFDEGHLCKPEEVEDDAWLSQRAIWRDGELNRDFFPLPETYKERRPGCYQWCRNNFDLYRKKVLKPLYDEVMSCDSYIICIDVLNILVMGPSYYTRTRQLLNAFYEKIVPGRLEQLWRTVTFSPLRIAFVATKSDMVQSDNLDRLKGLLNDLTKNCDSPDVKAQKFTCCAWKSTWRDAEGRLVMNYTDDKARPLLVHRDAGLMEPLLPARWPDAWNGEEFVCYDVSMAKPPRPVTKPPVAEGLAELFAFTLGVSK